ncbi:hypothetical protein ACFQGE_09255 [Halomicroarcula sp. GCM10025817]|uniref:hypothetical protein n=1 Tax=Haloarcula TaxID=2237 RepID=UPI0023E7A348|nr:hypothetical protein [Halomicroarcula sp. SYNS111]
MDDDEQPDWLTEMDEEILEILSTGLTLGPTAIAQNIDRSREGVSNRLNSLQAGGLVEKVDRGKYKLTDEGLRIHLGWDSIKTYGQTVAERIGQVRERAKKERLIQQDLGVSKIEYERQVIEEHERLKELKPDDEDILSEAIENVETRLREEKQNDS